MFSYLWGFGNQVCLAQDEEIMTQSASPMCYEDASGAGDGLGKITDTGIAASFPIEFSRYFYHPFFDKPLFFAAGGHIVQAKTLYLVDE